MSEIPEAQAERSDRAHARVQGVLRAGMITSTALMIAGLALRFAGGRDDAPALRIHDLVANGADLGLLLTSLGVVVLAVTPAVRAAALVGIWWRERDYRFVAVALAVVVTLAASVVLGKGG